jgi:hypothetical protein
MYNIMLNIEHVTPNSWACQISGVVKTNASMTALIKIVTRRKDDEEDLFYNTHRTPHKCKLILTTRLLATVMVLGQAFAAIMDAYLVGRILRDPFGFHEFCSAAHFYPHGSSSQRDTGMLNQVSLAQHQPCCLTGSSEGWDGATARYQGNAQER